MLDTQMLIGSKFESGNDALEAKHKLTNRLLCKKHGFAHCRERAAYD
jgi:hypothetical protein